MCILITIVWVTEVFTATKYALTISKEDFKQAIKKMKERLKEIKGEKKKVKGNTAENESYYK